MLIARWVLPVVAAAALLIVAVVTVLYLGQTDPTLGIMGLGAILVILWLILPARAGAAPRLLTLLILAFAFSSVLPSSISAIVQLITLAVGYLLWLTQPASTRRGVGAVALSFTIVLVWVALILHPNVPSLEVGILGFRKSALAVAGVALGAGIPVHMVPAVERMIVKVVLLAVSVSVVLHLLFPGLEQSVSRQADQYTALYEGQTRLQGVFAGPFHVALAALILLGWGLVRFTTSRALAFTAIAVGGVALALALVRTAFVALALVALVAALVAPSLGKALRRTIMVLSLGVIAVTIWVTVNPGASEILGSILNVSEDTRYQGRLPGYSRGIGYFLDSPIIGWGSGAAGDALGDSFGTGIHITSHNVALKIAVEAGLIGIGLWVALIVVIVRSTASRTAGRTLAATMLAALFGLGLTVASTETLPISYLVFVIIGLQLQTPAATLSSERQDLRSRRTYTVSS
ncbi:O-antigen ligase family protein [Microbacterium sp. SSW1-59]|uniref:O-antigen ligase family protein n=1 Tax=Microbacterium xanthum TaxID=3079794 RepID=UPI002AD1E4CE|nr:O-antigen ligase family protein [Microbacterium sp. SSW1-59]MDZ8201261.1 O-antigen ligase family protein [Microbacterium sp. SSW1-59]